MKVSIIGAGYVGLVSGACLAELGHEVACVDLSTEKVDLINRAIPPIFENGLEDLLARHAGKGLIATSDLTAAVLNSDITLIAVGTPFNGETIDLTAVQEAARSIGAALRDKQSYHVVIVKSTVVPGTTDNHVLPVLESSSGKQAGIHFGVGTNPEFLTEGEAVSDFMRPDRIVLGGIDERTIQALEELYGYFEGKTEFVKVNNKTAEMIKYASNCLLATAISLTNEFANLCSALGGMDIVDVMRGVHLSRYLSIETNGTRLEPGINRFFEAGCGFGGSCLPKDVKALIACGEQNGRSMDILKAVIRVNEHQPEQIFSALHLHFPSLDGVKVTVLGLAFKPDTTDMRESPAIPIIRGLLKRGAIVRAYDPHATDEARHFFPNGDVEFCDNLLTSVNSCDAVVLVTRWSEFASVPDLLRSMNPAPVLVDGRRMLDKRQLAAYAGIGL